MPAQIKSGSTVKANYSYLSDGTKTKALNASSVGYDYAGSFTYSHASNGAKTLESVAFGGGRIRKSGSTYAVDYHITDHLGSVRAIVNASGSVVEQNDYYPFGNRHPNGLTQLAANRWRFSGKEEQDAAFGIAYSDFGARFYDRSAAWTAVDPMAEKYFNISPYSYCSGNPVVFVDSNGRFAFVPFLAKMAIGVIVDLGMQITFNLAAGANLEEAFKKVDWTSVGASALIGPASSAKNGAKFLSYAIAFADAGVDFSSEKGWTRIGGGKEGYEVAIDALSGIGSSEISDGIVKAFRKEYNALSKNASYMAPLTNAERETIRRRASFVNSDWFEVFIQSISQFAGGLVDKSFIELIKTGSLSGGERGEPLNLYYEQWIQQQQGPTIQQGY
ncbi:MAG: RHS repeat-associated core domain-containing protein [Bacteroidales bacterium]|nr:RHS repeat-associated core domain-containing protein [Bacteroidales bacterium]